MWPLLQGWLLRNGMACRRGVAAVLFGARQAGRNAERVENMRRTVEAQHEQLEAASRRPRDPASLLAGCATERFDGAPCPLVVSYSQEFLARAADELDSLPAGSAIEQMLADSQVMRDQARACERFAE